MSYPDSEKCPLNPDGNGLNLPEHVVLFKNVDLSGFLLAEFWLKMLKFYALEFDIENLV